MCVLEVEGSEKKCGPPRIISGTALTYTPNAVVELLPHRNNYNDHVKTTACAVYV